MSHVTYPERAFLQLMGKRLLQYQREAASRSETYNDLSGYAPLQCGVRAKFRFEDVPGGYMPVAFLKSNEKFTPEELKEIASEILDAPVKLRRASDDGLEYLREKDSGMSVP